MTTLSPIEFVSVTDEYSKTLETSNTTQIKSELARLTTNQNAGFVSDRKL